MKRDNKKALYESIMTSVAKEVKKALNEGGMYYYRDELSRKELRDYNADVRKLKNVIYNEFNDLSTFDYNNWGKILAHTYPYALDEDIQRFDRIDDFDGDADLLYKKLAPYLGYKNYMDLYGFMHYEDIFVIVWNAIITAVNKKLKISKDIAEQKVEKLINPSRAEEGLLSEIPYINAIRAYKDDINNVNDIQDIAYEILVDYMNIPEYVVDDNDVYYICVKKLQETYNKLKRNRR